MTCQINCKVVISNGIVGCCSCDEASTGNYQTELLLITKPCWQVMFGACWSKVEASLLDLLLMSMCSVTCDDGRCYRAAMSHSQSRHNYRTKWMHYQARHYLLTGFSEMLQIVLHFFLQEMWRQEFYGIFSLVMAVESIAFMGTVAPNNPLIHFNMGWT